MMYLADITKNLSPHSKEPAKIPQRIFQKLSGTSSVPVTTFPCLPWAGLEVGSALSPREM